MTVNRYKLSNTSTGDTYINISIDSTDDNIVDDEKVGDDKGVLSETIINEINDYDRVGYLPSAQIDGRGSLPDINLNFHFFGVDDREPDCPLIEIPAPPAEPQWQTNNRVNECRDLADYNREFIFRTKANTLWTEFLPTKITMNKVRGGGLTIHDGGYKVTDGDDQIIIAVGYFRALDDRDWFHINYNLVALEIYSDGEQLDTSGWQVVTSGWQKLVAYVPARSYAVGREIYAYVRVRYPHRSTVELYQDMELRNEFPVRAKTEELCCSELGDSYYWNGRSCVDIGNKPTFKEDLSCVLDTPPPISTINPNLIGKTFHNVYNNAGFLTEDYKELKDSFVNSLFLFEFFTSGETSSDRIKMFDMTIKPSLDSSKDGRSIIKLTQDKVGYRLFWLLYDEEMLRNDGRVVYVKISFLNGKTGNIHNFYNIGDYNNVLSLGDSGDNIDDVSYFRYEFRRLGNRFFYNIRNYRNEIVGGHDINGDIIELDLFESIYVN